MSEAQRRFAVTHINLARQQARRFSLRHGIPYDELLGAAYMGLCKGALGYDPSRGHRPSSYLVPKVKGELLHHLRDTGFQLRISHRAREFWMRARRPLALGLSDAEIARRCGVALSEWLECRRACGQRPLSLEGELTQEIEDGDNLAAMACR
jgi:DNA-directed RNA polymerase specialized sigma subunit